MSLNPFLSPSGLSTAKPRIGLLGGSFNPPHKGHVHISVLAYKYLALDEVWWLVTPHNPLKQEMNKSLRAYQQRVDKARQISHTFPMIKVSMIEHQCRARSTYELVTLLQRYRCWCRCAYVFIMGADVVRDVPLWHKWSLLVQRVPLAIFDRPPYTSSTLNGQFAHRYRRYRKPVRQGQQLLAMGPPSWIFFHTAGRTDISSTHIRREHRASHESSHEFSQGSFDAQKGIRP
ncbi:MAG: nicotinic acid mononucleotide adenylyltransferase [Alphaproteobacteria bacterium GM7ARS4]|nr:nicotinic acid mononucleotide adenylyltransferase [Alphaproteobacteria bacterium GM7ARS4]